ncbi:hypothetical protein H310_03677 [Aphanomyces invadans]|uniref:Uncharacterized protein n=1 Tax=Aphanomyces invadans TaxID=157072 RepID=A0A024UKE1_9STRA|nr:hypothetical protein H310_03677 [Aphanomyces invadans]ETW06083.1 hypothetical protein H310_03677 [Aphanomyces invadans]|eukprot:XP_008865860.1 hypothetical protein H310_03677 [Aphanomyces invadans]
MVRRSSKATITKPTPTKPSAASQTPSTPTTRDISQGAALLNNLEQQRKDKRSRYSTVLPEEPDNDAYSTSPFFDSFESTQGPEGIHTMSNFTPSEFNLLATSMHLIMQTMVHFIYNLPTFH